MLTVTTIAALLMMLAISQILIGAGTTDVTADTYATVTEVTGGTSTATVITAGTSQVRSFPLFPTMTAGPSPTYNPTWAAWTPLPSRTPTPTP